MICTDPPVRCGTALLLGELRQCLLLMPDFWQQTQPPPRRLARLMRSLQLLKRPMLSSCC